MSSKELKSIKQRLAKLEQELYEIHAILKKLETSEDKKYTQEEIQPVKVKRIFEFKQSLENFFGTNLIAKAGFLAILLAFIWFLTYAFENYWINESGRIFLAILGGYFLWGLSFYFYKRNYEKLSPTMLGTGISVVFLGVFSAYRFYDFLTIQETFVGMFLLSGITILFSKLARSEVLYIFGILVVFLNPILLSTGENSYKFLFSYLTFWNFIHVWMGKTFYWRASAIFIPSLNILIYGIWAKENLHQSSFLIPFLFLVFSFVGILVREFYFQPQLTKQMSWTGPLAILLGCIGYGSLMNWTARHFYPQFAPNLILLLSLLPFLFLLYPKEVQSKAEKMSGFGILGSAYLFVLATLSIWEGEWANLPFLIVSGGLVTLGAKQNQKIFYYLGVILWFFTLISLVFNLSTTQTIGILFFNTRFLVYLLGIGILIFNFIQVKENSDFQLKNFFYIAPLFILIFASMVEMYHYVQNLSYRNLSYSYVLAFYSGVYLAHGFIKDSLETRKIGIILIGLLVVKFYLYDIWQMSLIVKIISGFSLGLGLVVVGIFYEKFKAKLLGEKE